MKREAAKCREQPWPQRISEHAIDVCSAAAVPDQPRVYFRNIVGFGTTRSYDPAPDGKHIVALTAADSAHESQDRVVFLLNFLDELLRRVPVGAN